MDRERFDTLTRLLATTPSRRAALGALLAATVAGVPGLSEAKTKHRKKRRKQQRKKDREQERDPTGGSRAASLNAEAVQCEPPRPSDTLKGCNYNDRDLRGVDMHSSTLTDAKFRTAILCEAKLYSAQLRRADFRGANLTRADLHSSGCVNTKFDAGTTWCRTIDCNGNLRNDDCPGTPDSEVCCTSGDCPNPAKGVCVGGACRACTAVTCPDGCCSNGRCVATCPGGGCCDNGQCVATCPSGSCCSDGTCVASCPNGGCCNSGQCAATCLTCSQQCANCAWCIEKADGTRECAAALGFASCQQCTSDAQCTDPLTPFCVARATNVSDGNSFSTCPSQFPGPGCAGHTPCA
jgi:hypothetical protein